MEDTQPSPSVQGLLAGLEQKQDDQVGLSTLTGRAVSRSDSNIHLAVRGGIVAIPIANIDAVVSLSKSQPDAVRIAVRDPAVIKPLLKVMPVGGSGGGASGGGGTVEEARNGERVPTDRTYKVYQGVATCTYTDTDTISGGEGQPDQCDDSEPDSCPADDTME